jgi:hypothetical protein
MAAIPKGGGTDNVLIDLGCPDAAALTAKPILAKKLNDIVDSGRLAQSDAAGSGAIGEKSFAQCAAALGGGAFAADKLRNVIAPAGFLDHKIHGFGLGAFKLGFQWRDVCWLSVKIKRHIRFA